MTDRSDDRLFRRAPSGPARVSVPGEPAAAAPGGALARARTALRRFRSESRAERLPARVREAIRVQQHRAEVLIGWIQLAVVLTFGTLYAIAPKTFSAEDTFAPVPWVLGAYFVFTVLRLALTHAGRCPDWVLYLSVVMDMALLFGLIWSFHLQYRQPASFYLKAPTLLYVFIFIALRALRFEVRFVVTAGLAAAIGWLLLVLYVIRVDPHDAMITRDYVEYMTSNSVLLGAEFDKVISILMVTGILALAIARARHLMVVSVVEAKTARDLSRFVPSQVVEQIVAAEDQPMPGAGEAREATMLFIDIEGFTTLSEQVSPAELIRMLNEYFAVVVEPIERNGGVVNQYQGDAILATFNLPSERPDHAADAVRAALEIRRALAGQRFGHGVRLRSRIGINTGIVVGGMVGTGDRLGYTVHGDAVNVAARLEQLNKQHGTGLLVSERTRELAGPEAFAFERIGAVEVRGRRRPATVYTVSRGQTP